MADLLSKKFTVSKKGADGKYQAVAWIQKSDKYDNLSCSINVERMKELLKNAEGKYVYCSVFVDDVEQKETPAPKVEEPAPMSSVPDDIPF